MVRDWDAQSQESEYEIQVTDEDLAATPEEAWAEAELPIETEPRALTALARARQARARMEVDRRQYIRSVAEAVNEVGSQSELAEKLHISQPAVSKVLASASSVEAIPKGFAGATPLEIAQAFAAGYISRDELVRQLASWDYIAQPSTNGIDDILELPPGTFGDVFTAVRQGYIDMAIYADVQAAIVNTRTSHR
jgi:DNA-binding transcriptional regulator YdaS (Cro superfamily)